MRGGRARGAAAATATGRTSTADGAPEGRKRSNAIFASASIRPGGRGGRKEEAEVPTSPSHIEARHRQILNADARKVAADSEGLVSTDHKRLKEILALPPIVRRMRALDEEKQKRRTATNIAVHEGVSEALFIQWIDKELEDERACMMLPFSLMVLLTFCYSAMFHLGMEYRYLQYYQSKLDRKFFPSIPLAACWLHGAQSHHR